MRRIALLLVAVLAATLAAGCGSSGSSGGSGSGGSSSKDVTLYLDFAIDGLHAPFFVAREKGFYKAEHLNIAIQPGKGSSDTVRVVGAGRAQLGLVDAGTVSKGVAQGAQVHAVGLVLSKTATGILTRKDEAIAQPDQLRGKTIGDADVSSTAALLPAFLKANGMSSADVKFTPMALESRVPSLLQGRIDAILGYVQEFVNIQDKTSFMPWADHGLGSYGTTIVANDAFAKSDPAAVRAFVRASLRGLDYTLAHPAEAASILAKASNGDADYFTREIGLLKPYFATSATERMTDARWAATQDLVVGSGQQSKRVPLSALYTDSFLP